MAKSARSSARKTNNRVLRARLFEPLASARTDRLSQKLLELAQQPRSTGAEKEMDIEHSSKPLLKSDRVQKKTMTKTKKRRSKTSATTTFHNLRPGLRRPKVTDGKRGRR